MLHLRNATWALCGALGATASANVINVPGDAATIQAGINLAVNGDEVVLAAGTYTGAGNRDLDFGGKSITLRSASGAPASCVIDCQGQGRGSFFHSGEPAAAVVQGITITNGFAIVGGGMHVLLSCPSVRNCVFSGNVANGSGAGMFNLSSCPAITGCTFIDNVSLGAGAGGVDNVSSDPILDGCAFIDNSASFGSAGGVANRSNSDAIVKHCLFSGNEGFNGGGLANWAGSDPTIQACTFNDNLSIEGGGIFNQDSAPLIEDSTFENNSAPAGGGLYNVAFNGPASPTLVRCRFAGNFASGPGGAVRALGPSPLLVNCVLAGNEAVDGAGLAVSDGAASLVNCTLTGNEALNSPGAIWVSRSDVTLNNCIVWQNVPCCTSSLTVSFSDVEGGAPGAGNISEDPRLVAPAGGDFRLSAGSPAIDAGDNAAVPPGVVSDLEGNPRFVDDPATPDTGLGRPPVVDMGALEFQPPCPGDIDADGTVGIVDFLALLGAWGPNPGHPADLDGDGTVGILDFLALLGNWGPCA